jgi:DNA-binding transcriptional regulator YbjK
MGNPPTQQQQQQQQHAAAGLHHHAAAALPALSLGQVACLHTPDITIWHAQVCTDAITEAQAQLSSLAPVQGILHSSWLTEHGTQVADRLRGMLRACRFLERMWARS